MRSLFKQTTAILPRVIAFTGVGLLVFTLFSNVLTAQATANQPKSGQRLITVHDGGQDRGLLTSATTLRAAFAQASISLDKNDLIEPGLDQELVANNYEVNVYRARPVMIIDGAIRQKVMSPYQTAEQITKNAGITLHDEDKTTISQSEDIVSDGSGFRLTIDRATPFTLVLYGQKVDAYTQSTSVGDMMTKKAIKLGHDDTLSVPAVAPITAGMTVEIWHNGKQTVTEEQPVAFDTDRIQDADHNVGYREIKTPGENGKKTVTYEVEMKNGAQVSRTEIQSVVTLQSKKQVEIVGTKPVFTGDFSAALAKLAQCESGGNYANTHNPSYRGAFQYDYSTWANYGGYYDPAAAPASVQDQKAWETYQRRGWQPWPVCGAQRLPDIYR
jgi:uncharacterized protein YabE (DUF348 family)